MRVHLPFALFAALLLNAGCGGGGTSSLATVTLDATPALTASMDERGNSFSPGDTLFLGDIFTAVDPEGGLRGFVSFDLGTIPAGAQVESATLGVTQTGAGNAPYSLGALLIDQAVYGNVLEVGAYSRAFPLNQGFATLSLDPTIGPKSADVTLAVQADRTAMRTQSQFRLRFPTETNSNGVGDQCLLAGAADAGGPVLIVTYRP